MIIFNTGMNELLSECFNLFAFIPSEITRRKSLRGFGITHSCKGQIFLGLQASFANIDPVCLKRQNFSVPHGEKKQFISK